MTHPLWISSAIGVATVWLLVLTVGVMLCIRQLGALTARMEIVAMGSGAGQGAALGFQISGDLARAHPGLAAGRRIVLVLSATCASCAELMRRIDLGDRPQSLGAVDGVIALLVGADDPSRRSSRDVLSDVAGDVVVDPLATAVAQALRMKTIPSALYLIDGVVAGTIMFLDRLEQIDDMVHSAELGAGHSLNGDLVAHAFADEGRR